MLKENLRILMVKNKFTTTALAHESKISQPLLHRIISGTTEDPKLSIVIKLAGVFRVAVSQLIGELPLTP